MASPTPLSIASMARKKPISPTAAAEGRRTGMTTTNDTQVQLRLPNAIVRAMKQDAFDTNQTLSNFVTTCYLAAKKAGTHIRKLEYDTMADRPTSKPKPEQKPERDRPTHPDRPAPPQPTHPIADPPPDNAPTRPTPHATARR
jgi:hypothetical protein